MEVGWSTCTSRAVEAYWYFSQDGVLQIVFRQGCRVYDYLCDRAMYEAFERAASKGRFVDQVLKPHAHRLGPDRRGSGEDDQTAALMQLCALRASSGFADSADPGPARTTTPGR